jgi:hypothetical protein
VTLKGGTDRNGEEVRCGERVQCMCGACGQAVIQVAIIGEEHFYPAKGKGIMRSFAVKVPDDTPLKAVPEPPAASSPELKNIAEGLKLRAELTIGAAVEVRRRLGPISLPPITEEEIRVMAYIVDLRCAGVDAHVRVVWSTDRNAVHFQVRMPDGSIVDPPAAP